MKKGIRWTLIIVVLALLGMQFIGRHPNNGSASGEADIVTAYAVPEQVATVLKKACYDCHSNHTEYPWYYGIQPVAWWMDDHVNEGKRELNFSEFKTFKTKRKLKKLKEIIHEVEEGDMPLSSYTWMHKEATLTAEEKQAIIEWSKALSLKIAMEEPATP